MQFGEQLTSSKIDVVNEDLDRHKRRAWWESRPNVTHSKQAVPDRLMRNKYHKRRMDDTRVHLGDFA